MGPLVDFANRVLWEGRDIGNRNQARRDAERREMTDSLRERIARAIVDAAYGGSDHHEEIEAWLPCADAALAAIEASGTHVIAPLEPTQEQQISGVMAMAKALEPFIAKLRAEGRESDAITLSVISSGHITGPIYRAALAARPRYVAPTNTDTSPNTNSAGR